MTRPGRAWVALSAALGLLSLLGWVLPSPLLDWQPAQALAEPWRWWTAAAVHWSERHLLLNLAGLAGVALLGHLAEAPLAWTGAWLAAWPLTQGALLLQPEWAHFGGLSGVLHAAVAVLALGLAWRGPGLRRAVGLSLAAGLSIKVGVERPWLGAPAMPAGWDLSAVPLVHASGALAGALCAAFALAWDGRRR